MSAFDKVIGYEGIKKELLQICDMIQNREVYENLGARLPQGFLLYGDPGLGKSLMAKCLIEESGIAAYTLRRKKGAENFVDEISEVFQKAKENAPSIVFLDDMDKFANEDDKHRDAEEYVAVQAAIDEVNGQSVFVLATVNDMDKLPDSLIRLGRFDRKIKVCSPSIEDACKIVEHYLKGKKVAKEVDMGDVTRMLDRGSCAELESVLNGAAIQAAFARRDAIAMEDIISAVLGSTYEAPENSTERSFDDRKIQAIHEAGHLVISEVLCPGSIGLVSVRSGNGSSQGGFVRRCKELPVSNYHMLICLGGVSAVKLYYAEDINYGESEDIREATRSLSKLTMYSGAYGLGLLDVARFDSSDSMTVRHEAVVHAELERYLIKARDILLKNREFLEKTTEELLRKQTLLYSDIQAIRESVIINKCVA